MNQSEPSTNYAILIVIPAYNEGENLPATVADVRGYLPHAEILVVDDGSTDNTASVAKELGCRLLKMPFNVGIGVSVQAGFQFAREHDFDFAVQFDGDGQHSAESLSRMLEAAIGGEADLVIGSRYLDENDYETPVARRMGMVIFSRIISLILKQRITDSTSGFRVLNREAIEFCADNYPADYPEVEILPLLHFDGIRIMEVPVIMRARQNGRSSITWSKAAYYMVKVVLAISISLLRERPERRDRGVA